MTLDMRLLALTICFLPPLAWGDDVRVDHGNVLLDRPGQPTRQLTHAGRDRDAQLSPDGRWVVYVREAPSAQQGETLPSEIRLVPVGPGQDRVLVASGHACGSTARLDGLSSPQFLSDSRRIVFESLDVVTSGSVHLTSVSGGCRRIASSNGAQVVRSGELRDGLILNQHRYFLAGGSYDWYWLYTLDGREIGAIGTDEQAVAEFLAERGGAEPGG